MEILARAALMVSSVVLAGSLLMLPATRSGTPERAITLFSLGGGLVAIATSAALIRLRRRGRN